MKRKGEVIREEAAAKKRFTSSNCKVVEYLGQAMSKDLLFKFPDISAFDFDYSQSSIWSPLVPRVYSPMDLDSHFITPTKLTFGLGLQSGSNKNNYRSYSSKKVPSTFKKKLKIMNYQKKKVSASGFSPTPVKGACIPLATKGWNKVLKAATKHFRKQKNKGSTGHVKLSNFLTDFNN